MLNIGLLGLGNIGGALAQGLLSWDANIYAYDVQESILKGKVMDLEQARALGFPSNRGKIAALQSTQALAFCDAIVITAGKARISKNPGEQHDRYQLLENNGAILKDIALALRGTKALIIVVTNPVDIMAWHFWRWADIPAHRVMGMAGVLDSARFRLALAHALDVSVHRVSGLVIGPHHDQMIPVRASVMLDGHPLEPGSLTSQQWECILHDTKKGGGTIAALLGQGSAFFTPAAAVLTMLDALFYQQNRLLPCSIFHPMGCGNGPENGSGNEGVFCGALTHLQRCGAFEAPANTLTLDQEEQKSLAESMLSLRTLCQRLNA